MAQTATQRYEVVDFAQIPPAPCPCGEARRAFVDVEDFPASVHRTQISDEARVHYHKRLTEVYYFLECGPDAQMQLDDSLVPVRAGMCVLIRPGVRHKAIGRMTVIVVCLPKFDSADEWFD